MKKSESLSVKSNFKCKQHTSIKDVSAGWNSKLHGFEHSDLPVVVIVELPVCL